MSSWLLPLELEAAGPRQGNSTFRNQGTQTPPPGGGAGRAAPEGTEGGEANFSPGTRWGEQLGVGDPFVPRPRLSLSGGPSPASGWLRSGLRGAQGSLGGQAARGPSFSAAAHTKQQMRSWGPRGPLPKCGSPAPGARRDDPITVEDIFSC